MLSIYKKELGSYFRGILGYVFIAMVLVFTGFYTMYIVFLNLLPNFEYVISNMTFFYLFLIPMLTMRSISEEKRQKTDQLLYSLPMSMGKIVTGKFLAMATVLLFPTLEMCLIPPVIARYGNVNFAIAYSSIFGYYMLGLALIAIGLFISSLTENQIVAMIVSFFTVLILYLMSSISSFISATAFASYVSFMVLILIASIVLFFMVKNFYVAGTVFIFAQIILFLLYNFKTAAFEGAIQTVLAQCSLFDRLSNFINGMFDGTCIVYYLSILLLFLFLSVQSMEKRRWS